MTGPAEHLAAAFDRLGLSAGSHLASRAGVTVRQLANAVTGRPVATIPFLRLCAAIGHDPLPDLPHRPETVPADFDPVVFAMAMRMRRGLKGQSVREGGAEMGFSGFTVSRVENAHAVGIGVVLRACLYIGTHPFGYFKPHDVGLPTISRETRISATS